MLNVHICHTEECTDSFTPATDHHHILHISWSNGLTRSSLSLSPWEYLAKWLTSLSSTSAPFGRCIYFSEPGMNISGLSDRSSEEWKERGKSKGECVGREVQRGMGNQIWFCRSHKWLKPCRFQSDCPTLHHLHWFPAATVLPPLVYDILQIYDEPRTNH